MLERFARRLTETTLFITSIARRAVFYVLAVGAVVAVAGCGNSASTSPTSHTTRVTTTQQAARRSGSPGSRATTGQLVSCLSSANDRAAVTACRARYAP